MIDTTYVLVPVSYLKRSVDEISHLFLGWMQLLTQSFIEIQYLSVVLVCAIGHITHVP